MARARGGGGSGSAWALVIFGAGFFICLILAIIFFTQINGAKEAQKKAENSLREFVTGSEQGLPEVDELRARDGSVVGALLEERGWLRKVVASDPTKSQEEIEASINSLSVQGKALLQEVTQLQNQLSGANEMQATLNQELEAARARAEEAETSKATLDANYKNSLASLQQTLDQTKAALEATRQKIQEQKSSLDGEMAATRSEFVDQIASLENTLSDRQKQIDDLRKELYILRGTNGQDPGPGNITRPDGRIVSMGTNPGEVFISLGRDDRLQLGMTFEVFDTNELIKLTEYNELRGKATLEIVSVDESASLARVVRLERGRAISEGDAIVNLVYDPEATYKFYVYGDFSFDGLPANEAGRDRIVSKILQWGGKVSDELTYDVDYLVLGEEPPLPPPDQQGEVDPVKIAERVQAQRIYETYQELIGEARNPSLNIPILNQNRFLALVGDYDR